MKFKSKFELRFAGKLEEQGVKFKYEPSTFKFMMEHSYTPDFKIGEIFIETKGRFTGRDRSKHLKVKQQHPHLDIRFVFMNASNKLYKGSETTYAMWCEKHGFLWADKEAPKEWLVKPRKGSR